MDLVALFGGVWYFYEYLKNRSRYEALLCGSTVDCKPLGPSLKFSISGPLTLDNALDLWV